MIDRTGSVAVVTGAASGIGLALARRLALDGMRVAMADVQADAVAAAAREVASSTGVEPLSVVVDVSSWDSVQRFAEQVHERLGPVRVLCNNAGVIAPQSKLWEVPLEDWRWVLDVDLWGVIHGVKAFLPRMIESGEPGHVVNTASIAGIIPFPDLAPYAVAKHAVVAISEMLKLGLAEQGAPIGVSVLCPGHVATAIGDNSNRLRPKGPGWKDTPAPPNQMQPEEMAEIVSDAIRDDRFWVLPHENFRDRVERQAHSLLAAIERLPVQTNR